MVCMHEPSTLQDEVISVSQGRKASWLSIPEITAAKHQAPSNRGVFFPLGNLRAFHCLRNRLGTPHQCFHLGCVPDTAPQVLEPYSLNRRHSSEPPALNGSQVAPSLNEEQ